jgi:catalase
MNPTTMRPGLYLAALLAITTTAGHPARAADAPSLAEQTVDALNKLWGKHPGIRANHAKGLVVEGTFTASPGAKALSKAGMFNGTTIKVTGRYSDSTGLPDIADGDGKANPHGLAVRFHQTDGADVDIVENSLPFFPVANGEGFRDFLLAAAESGPGAAKPTKLDAFFASHPAAPRALGTLGTPNSLAHEQYNGIDAFILVNAAGVRQPVRFRAVPVEGVKHITPAEAAKQPPNFLFDEMRTRLATSPVQYHLMAQLADPGDQTKDPTQPWPADRKLVNLGTITITSVDPDSTTAEKSLLFLPGNLTDGIEPSDDPLIDARNQAYAVSYGRRIQ